jgi:hypothetical protein
MAAGMLVAHSLTAVVSSGRPETGAETAERASRSAPAHVTILLVHQIDESHAGIAAIAATPIVLHLIIAGTPAVLLGRRTDGAVVVPGPAT